MVPEKLESPLDGEVRRIHFVGVGGAGMSGLAEVLLGAGYQVTGCDIRYSPVIARLEEKGLSFVKDHAAEHVDDCDMVIYTAAVKKDLHPETVRAAQRNLPVLSRAELLGRVLARAEHSVAIAGTHGKTTTTAMIGVILKDAKMDPTILVGGDVPAIGGNARIGARHYMVTEACEFENSFLTLRPEVGLILNIDDDHLDFFKNMEGVVQGFREFIGRIKPDGILITSGDNEYTRQVAESARVGVETFGLGPGNVWRAASVGFRPGTAYPVFDLLRADRRLTTVELGTPGEHNVQNALAAAAAAFWLGVAVGDIADSLHQFRGVHRRFEFLGRCNGASVIDDYAHHPTALRYTIETARRFRPQRLYVVFQPHLFSRTLYSRREFVGALALADETVLLNIYAARERDTGQVTASDLVLDIKALGAAAVHMPSHAEAAAYLRSRVGPGDMVLTVGAGDVDKVGHLLVTGEGGSR